MVEKTNLFIQDGALNVDILPLTSADQVSMTDSSGNPSTVELEIKALRTVSAVQNAGATTVAANKVTIASKNGAASNVAQEIQLLRNADTEINSSIAAIQSGLVNNSTLVHTVGNENIGGDKNFIGNVTAITRGIADNSNVVATTKFVKDVVQNALANIPQQNISGGTNNSDETIGGNKTFIGSVKVPSPNSTDRSLTAATTAFVGDAIAAAMSEHIINNETITGNKSYTGDLRAVTQPATDNGTLVATTEFVTRAISAALAPILSRLEVLENK